jgi:hypothetical protein
MLKSTLAGAALLVTLLVPGLALAQTPLPDALAAARELVAVSGAAESAKLLLPSVVQLMKPAIVQGRPQVEKDFDALAPQLLESFNARVNDLIDQIVIIYATNFTAAEIKEIITFYHGPAGQKFLARGPTIAQQSMAAGQRIGAQIGRELQTRMIGELKKRGHNI